MDMNKEREVFESAYRFDSDLKYVVFCDVENKYKSQKEYEDYESVRQMAGRLNSHWGIWKAAKAQAVPEGFVLVPKEKFNVFWQDDDEPENFCSSETGFNSLGDCIDIGEVMNVKKHTLAHIETEILWGTWKYEKVEGSILKSEFFVGSYEDCLAIVEAAQGEGHDHIE